MRELTVGDHLDQYLLMEVLARTAMATTFKGHDTEAGAPVCLKVPHLEYESDIVFHERFEREERIGRRLEHRNIVRALEPRTKSRMYLVTEYVAGTTLRREMGAGSLPTERALDIACQLCEALVYLHARGIVHRDLKPENVIIGAGGQVKLLDFGIALDRAARRLTWSNLSATLGTPDYMAPEQIGGRRGDERCDVYAAGLILYEMLTGRLPFSGPSPRAVMRAKTHGEPKLATYFAPRLDPGLGDIIDQAIARAPRDRHQSAADLLDRLRRPQAARGSESLEGVDDAPSAHPRVARLVAALILATLVSLTWLSHRADPGAARTSAVSTRQGEEATR
jgi:eukaryotic-like serine/threonine-protein kinase